jgi:hypothetical protein
MSIAASRNGSAERATREWEYLCIIMVTNGGASSAISPAFIRKTLTGLTVLAKISGLRLSCAEGGKFDSAIVDAQLAVDWNS